MATLQQRFQGINSMAKVHKARIGIVLSKAYKTDPDLAILRHIFTEIIREKVANNKIISRRTRQKSQLPPNKSKPGQFKVHKEVGGWI